MRKRSSIISLLLVISILFAYHVPSYASSTNVQVSVPKRTTVTITAKNAAKFVGLEDPELKYKVSGTLSKNITGIVVERQPGETVGKYVIKARATSYNTKYKYVFKDGTFTIKEMSPLLKKIKDFKDFLDDVPLYISLYDQVIVPIIDFFKDLF